MPHTHSPAAAVRRLRALKKGYLSAKPDACESKFVLVASSVAPRLKSIAHSLALHDRHDSVAGVHCHYARNAARAARPFISDSEFKAASSAHRAANRAKHNGADRERWADSADCLSASDGDDFFVADDGVPAPALIAICEVIDPLFIDDPWAAAAPLLEPKLPPCGPTLDKDAK